MTGVVVAALLIGAVALQLLAALGVAIVRNPFDRLHFTTPPAFAALLVAVAVLVDVGPSIAAEKVGVLAAVVLAGSPVTVQALARATRRAHADEEDDR